MNKTHFKSSTFFFFKSSECKALFPWYVKLRQTSPPRSLQSSRKMVIKQINNIVKEIPKDKILEEGKKTLTGNVECY